MINFLTATGTHTRVGATIATGVVISPPDPMQVAPGQDYPTEKLFLMRECYTKATGFLAGDYLVIDSTTYAIRSVLPWAEQGGLDDFYRLILEEQRGS